MRHSERLHGAEAEVFAADRVTLPLMLSERVELVALNGGHLVCHNRLVTSLLLTGLLHERPNLMVDLSRVRRYLIVLTVQVAPLTLIAHLGCTTIHVVVHSWRPVTRTLQLLIGVRN